MVVIVMVMLLDLQRLKLLPRDGTRRGGSGRTKKQIPNVEVPLQLHPLLVLLNLSL